ncbi:MAG: pantoate--beta-alanine ligase [Acidobacteria bacterium]|nr:pantoate--beta-alanine ligase [Acidobacteriota bacterium]
MEVISKTNKLKAVLRKTRCAGLEIGFVPTMGALHEGHLALVQRARESAGVIVVSIFVNPVQFGPNEDYEKYPRNLSHDVELLTRLGVDYVFAPGVDEIYPAGFDTFVDVRELTEPLCGRTRPGHFRGVATVVAKLFSIIQPMYAFFGQKDAQQAIIIKKMTAELDFPVDVRICPIVREPDGLAMSSRNQYLSPEERAAAPVLYRSLQRAAAMILEGERDAATLRQEIEKELAREPLARPEYVEIVETQTLAPVEKIRGETLIALAASFGQTRLIDNLLVSTP